MSDTAHEVVPLWVPVCETCGRDIALNDDEVWEHVEVAGDE